MRRRYEFILTNNKIYMCRFCGNWQRISRFEWLALLHCKRHERTCEGNGK